jgi:acetylornithine deacetylase/succinyl-diaminopimelate desuccinylase-like protein
LPLTPHFSLVNIKKENYVLNKLKYAALFTAISLIIPVAAPARPDIHDEAVTILQEYLRINTTNPPGNEMLTAKFLKKILDREGIENKIFNLGNNRANLYAIIRGNGSKKPLVMMHHMDVVPADAKYWSVPPFSGKIVNGEIYGRGAIDIKGKGIVDLMTMVNLKRNKFPLKRDLVFLAVADEEVGSLGSKWMIKNKPELVKNAEYLFDEGETVYEDEKGNVSHYFVGIGEKSPLWLTLTFTGRPGHGSVPISDSSVNRAIEAANRILEYSKDMVFHIVPGIEESIKVNYKGDLSKLPGYEKDLTTSLKNQTFLEELAKDPDFNALLRNTISITGLKGSDKINIIPNEASLNLDCRLVPGIEKDAFLAELKKVINDNTVKIKVDEFYSARYSSSNTEYMKILERLAKKRNKNAKLVPTIFTSSTDSSLYRALGINVYGFEGYPLDDEISDTAHGNNERIKVKNVKAGIDIMTEILTELNK